jgi:hypothetical protein
MLIRHQRVRTSVAKAGAITWWMCMATLACVAIASLAMWWVMLRQAVPLTRDEQAQLDSTAARVEAECSSLIDLPFAKDQPWWAGVWRGRFAGSRVWISPSGEFVVWTGAHRMQPRVCGRVRVISDSELFFDSTIRWPREIETYLHGLKRLEVRGADFLLTRQVQQWVENQPERAVELSEKFGFSRLGLVSSAVELPPSRPISDSRPASEAARSSRR